MAATRAQTPSVPSECCAKKDIYEGVPLAALSKWAREIALKSAVRQVLNHEVADPSIGGEIKSSLMEWDKNRRGYVLKFPRVHAGEHDVLYLAWMTPRGIHVFKHVGKTCLSLVGKEAIPEGKTIKMRAPSGEKGYTSDVDAENHFLKWYNHHNMIYVAYLPFGEGDNERVTERVKQIVVDVVKRTVP